MNKITIMITAYLIMFIASLAIIPCSALALDCSYDPRNSSAKDPSLAQIVCPFSRFFNVLVYSSGAVFVIVMLYGAIKLGISLGDPKGYQAAQLTWNYGVLGFLIIVGFFLIFNIIMGFVGVTGYNPFDQIASAIKTYTCCTKLQTTGCGGCSPAVGQPGCFCQ